MKLEIHVFSCIFLNTSNKFLDYLLSSDEIEDPNKYSKFFPEMKLDDNDLGSDTDNGDDDDDDDDDLMIQLILIRGR